MVQGREGAGDGQVPDHAHGRRHHHRDHELDAGRLRQVQVRRHQQPRLRHHGMRCHMRRYVTTWGEKLRKENKPHCHTCRLQHERRTEEHVGPNFVLGWVANLMAWDETFYLLILDGKDLYDPLFLWYDRKKACKGIFNPEEMCMTCPSFAYNSSSTDHKYLSRIANGTK